MTISSVSADALAGLASEMKSAQIGQQIGVAVLKTIQDQQQRQAEQLLQMIRQTQAIARGGVEVTA
jgi:hypothetical protein